MPISIRIPGPKKGYKKLLFLLALAGALTLSSFAADKNKPKAKKNKKSAKTEQCCTESCNTKCTPKPGYCKM